MKKKLALLGILILLFAGFVGVRYFFLQSENQFGRIKILSSPSATVFIDNTALIKTPFEDKYKVGEYLVKLIPEGTASETASWQGKVKIYKNSLTYVNRELGNSDITSAGEIFTVSKAEQTTKSGTGEIYVETEPSGAIVYLDNDEKGVSTLILADIPKGEHELSIFMPGFFKRTQKINIDPGYRVNAQVKLALDQSQKPTPSAQSLPAGGKTSTASASLKTKILIKDTPLGFLRVREDASVTASESGRVNPGDEFDMVDEKNDWYKIAFEKNKEGWVYSQYAEKKE